MSPTSVLIVGLFAFSLSLPAHAELSKDRYYEAATALTTGLNENVEAYMNEATRAVSLQTALAAARINNSDSPKIDYLLKEIGKRQEALSSIAKKSMELSVETTTLLRSANLTREEIELFKLAQRSAQAQGDLSDGEDRLRKVEASLSELRTLAEGDKTNLKNYADSIAALEELKRSLESRIASSKKAFKETMKESLDPKYASARHWIVDLRLSADRHLKVNVGGLIRSPNDPRVTISSPGVYTLKDHLGKYTDALRALRPESETQRPPGQPKPPGTTTHSNVPLDY